MRKTILITGSTDGIGLETAKILAEGGNHILLHGRNETKLEKSREILSTIPNSGQIETYVADLSRIEDVEALARAVTENHKTLDVLINNAGVYSVSDTKSGCGLDVRFVVNTISPYLLTTLLLPSLDETGRVINLSSAAQSSVDVNALKSGVFLPDGIAYSQSKLALTMWSRHMAEKLGTNNPAIIAVNPASMLASKMVKDAYGVAGNDLQIGADIISRAAVSDEFANASGKYFDNDVGKFTNPHNDALDPNKVNDVVNAIKLILNKIKNT